MNALLAFGEGLFAPSHIIIVLIVGVLLFGKRLPEIGRSLGKGLVEFKKGLKGLEDDVDVANQPLRQEQAMEQPRPPQRVAATTPKFEDTAANIKAPPKV
jgi:sec-independent protein translocase protein TatA